MSEPPRRPFRFVVQALDATSPRTWADPACQGLPHDREAANTCGHKAQQRLRDVLATELGEGATNIQRLLLARQLLGARPGYFAAGTTRPWHRGAPSL